MNTYLWYWPYTDEDTDERKMQVIAIRAENFEKACAIWKERMNSSSCPTPDIILNDARYFFQLEM